MRDINVLSARKPVQACAKQIKLKYNKNTIFNMEKLKNGKKITEPHHQEIHYERRKEDSLVTLEHILYSYSLENIGKNTKTCRKTI